MKKLFLIPPLIALLAASCNYSTFVNPSNLTIPPLTQTYHNNKYQISFKYPDNWYVATNPGNRHLNNNAGNYYIEPNDPTSPYSGGFYLTIDCPPPPESVTSAKVVYSVPFTIDGTQGNIDTLNW